MAKEAMPKLLGKTEGTNVMRGRDVRLLLQGVDAHPKVKEVLERIAEINHINMTAIAELATNMDALVNIVQKFADVASNMKDRTDQMARAMTEGLEDHDEPSVN